MNIFKKIGKSLGKAAIAFDEWCNGTIGKCKKVWSDFGGSKRETISSTLGIEEAIALYAYWKKGGDLARLTDVEIEDKHLLGEFSSDLCDVFQDWHALRSINWKRHPELEKEYPGIRVLVDTFLESRGIKS